MGSGIREARKIMKSHYVHSKSSHESSHILKAGLTEFPTNNMFKPVHDMPIRKSMRNCRQKVVEEEEVSSMSSSGSSEEELFCALCGGIGYLSDIAKMNKNQKLIGPFLLN